jgi:DNA-directed RNA polymerase specialized sigma54-like protein
MERDLAAAKAAVEAESVRSRDFEKSSLDKAAALDAARTKAEESARDLERQQSEARILRESLAAREATIVQVLHALSERDAQLSSLQAEHAKVLPALEARS